MPFQVGIVGKTNVGKSTLLNMLARKKFTITANEPGVTRDRKEVKTEIGGRQVILVDTAGLEQIGKNGRYRNAKTQRDYIEATKDTAMYNQMIEQSIRVINTCDLILFVVDALNGVTEEDYYFADIARKTGKNVALIVNKAETQRKIIITSKELYKFGFNSIIFTSAEHAIGITDIILLIKKEMANIAEKLNEEETVEAEMAGSRVHIVIIGRPNAGKSTLVNQILQEERVITGEKAGITRDSISIDFTLLGKPVKLVDTAGIRKNTNKEGLEKLSIYETSRALRLGHVALLMIDATDPFVQQDLSIAGDILNEGRILIVVINKSDLLSIEKLEELKHQLKESISSFIRNIVHPEFCVISAKEGTGLRALYRKIFELYEGWNTKIKTNTLNNWLIQKIRLQPPPLLKGKEVRIKYISQIKIRPPTFAVFTNRKEGITDSYIRFLSNSIIKDFNLPGISVRISVRETENPYAHKAKPKPRGAVKKSIVKRAKKK